MFGRHRSVNVQTEWLQILGAPASRRLRCKTTDQYSFAGETPALPGKEEWWQRQGRVAKIILETAERACLSRSMSTAPKPVEFRALIWQSGLLRVGTPALRSILGGTPSEHGQWQTTHY